MEQFLREILSNIHEPDRDAMAQALARQESLAKPPHSLGKLEDISVKLAGMTGKLYNPVDRRRVLIFASDNGIVEEGISQSGQEVTRSVAEWMGRGESSVCWLAAVCKADTIPVDAGINMEGSPHGVADRKVMKGTRNFRKEPAMTEDECMQAINAGIDTVCECSMEGYRLLAAGEMGIGNTTTSAALASALLGLDVDEVTGRGAGLSYAGLKRKKNVFQKRMRDL